MQATGTATDPLGLTDSDTLTTTPGGATGVRTIRSSFLATRINWGNAIDELTRGPSVLGENPYATPGPISLGVTLTCIAPARSRGCRFYKSPTLTGAVPLGMWDSTGTLLATKTVTVGADSGGWVEVPWDAPVEMTVDETYRWGYLYSPADTKYAESTYVWNTQQTCVYPLLMQTYGCWAKPGGALQVGNPVTERSPSNFYVDPMVEWDVDIPGYDHGTDYWDQFPGGGPREPFMIGVFWPDEPAHAGYKALGINTIFAGSPTPSYKASVKLNDLDWWPTLYQGDTSPAFEAIEDTALGECIRGYFIADEPEMIQPFYNPATTRAWRNAVRRMDSTRPMFLNMSRITMENQGYSWQPTGILARDVNLQWREYAAQPDATSLDCYGIDHSFPFTYNPADTDRYGIWIYPLIIQRMRTEITDERFPIMGVVETTSAWANSPTVPQVERAVWASLIAGATAIEYFDHRFASAQVTQDFAAMLNDPAMSAAVQALNAQMQALAPALLAPDEGLIAGYTSTGALAKAQGGYAAGAKIPMHYTTRRAGGTTYLFVQSIRDGATTATLHAPSLAGATLTVIGEARTVEIDEDGFFTDTFTDGDYEYHLYSTDADPAFSAPVNTVAPAISGTAATGSTLSVSTGTWTGVPSPTFSYQWQNNGSNIPGATLASYVPVEADEGDNIRCVVTATNSQGSASANSNTVVPTPPATSGYATAVLADSPDSYWRLKTLSDEVGGHDFTIGADDVSDTASIITDAGDGAQNFDLSGGSYLTTPDHADLRIGLGGSFEMWVKPAFIGAFVIASKAGDFRFNLTPGSKFRFTPLGAGGWFTDVDSTTTPTVGTDYHLVGTWDVATKIMKIYVNGVLENTVDASTFGYSPTTSGWGPLVLGFNAGMGTGWEGVIDEAAAYAYGRVLSAAEVLAHYEAGIA